MDTDGLRYAKCSKRDRLTGFPLLAPGKTAYCMVRLSETRGASASTHQGWELAAALSCFLRTCEHYPSASPRGLACTEPERQLRVGPDPVWRSSVATGVCLAAALHEEGLRPPSITPSPVVAAFKMGLLASGGHRHRNVRLLESWFSAEARVALN